MNTYVVFREFPIGREIYFQISEDIGIYINGGGGGSWGPSIGEFPWVGGDTEAKQIKLNKGWIETIKDSKFDYRIFNNIVY